MARLVGATLATLSLVGAGTAAAAPAVAQQPTSLVELSIAISPYATYGPGAQEAVAQAVVSCDQPTALFVAGLILQADAIGAHSFTTPTESTWCRPGAPVRAFIPSRAVVGSGSFGSGLATVGVVAIPASSPILGAVSTARAVTMLDQVPLERFIIGKVVAGDTALGAIVQEHIAIRRWQDPAFTG